MFLRLRNKIGWPHPLGNVILVHRLWCSYPQKLFDFAVGPTRERYSKLQKTLPFVAADLEEGASLVQRLYLAEGFLDAAVDKLYRSEPFPGDRQRVEHLFTRYEKLVAPLIPVEKKMRRRVGKA